MDDLKTILVSIVLAWLFLAWLQSKYRLWQAGKHFRKAEWHKEQMGKYL